MASWSQAVSGREFIRLMKDMFNLQKDLPIEEISIHAEVGGVVRFNTTHLVQLRDVDIQSELLEEDTVKKETKYEITIKELQWQVTS